MKILIIHTFGLGDMIMFTPALQKLIDKYPNAQIDFLIFQKAATEPIKKFPSLGQIYYSKFSIKSLFKNLILLRKQNYDISILTSGTNPLKGGAFSYMIGAKERIGEYSTFIHKIFYTKPIKYIKNFHRVENNYMLISDGNVDYKPKFFGVLAQKKQNEKIIIGVHPGSNPKFKQRRWEKEYFVELIKMLKKNYIDIDVIIFAGPGEKEEGRYIANNTNTRLIADKSLDKVVNLISECDVFVNTDSGLGHIASCCDVEIFTIFGPAKDYKTKPYSNRANVIKLDMECQPCYGTKSMKLCKNHKCLMNLTPKIVFDFINKNSEVLTNVKN